MRHRTFAGIMFLTLFVTLVGLNLAAPAQRAAADPLLANLPRLDGQNVYFSEEGKAASRFDRGPEGLSRFAGLLELLGAELFTLEWRTGIPDDADLIVIPGPTADLSAEQTAWLWAYLQDGGKLLLVAEPPFGASRAFAQDRNLFALMWGDMGFQALSDVAVVESGELRPAVPPPARVGRDEPTSTPAPPVDVPVLLTDFAATTYTASHPLIGGLQEPVMFFGARSLAVDGAPRESQVTPLIFSPAGFYGEADFNLYLDSGYVEYNVGQDTARGELVLAAAMENILTKGRIVLIGDREVITNGYGFRTSPAYSSSFLYPGNVRFMVRAAAWLLEATSPDDELTFPTPGPTETPTMTPTPTITPLPDEGAAS